MLIGQASINLTANILSALLGLLSVFIFTRLFSPHDYGVYLLGVGFASVISVFLVGWFRNLILSEHARDDGTDVRGLVISGYHDLLSRRADCLRARVGWSDWIQRGAGRRGALGRDRPVRTDARSRSRPADGALGDEGDAGSRHRRARPRRRRRAGQPHRRPAAVVVRARLSARGAGAVTHGLARHDSQVRRRRPCVHGESRPAADAVADPACDLQRHRPLHDRQSGWRGGCRKICRQPRPRQADADDAGDERRRGVLPARGTDTRQPGRRGGKVASRRMRRIAVQHHAAGLPRLRRHFRPYRQRHPRRRLPRAGRARPCRSSRLR